MRYCGWKVRGEGGWGARGGLGAAEDDDGMGWDGMGVGYRGGEEWGGGAGREGRERWGFREVRGVVGEEGIGKDMGSSVFLIETDETGLCFCFVLMGFGERYPQWLLRCLQWLSRC